MKTAVVLSGGGAKGAYQIGVWKALRKLHIKYDIVTGTSVGALNGVLMVQKSFNKAYKIWSDISYEKVFGPKYSEKIAPLNTKLDVYKEYAKNFLTDGGMDTTAIENLFGKHISPIRFKLSKVDYGIITYNVSTMKAKEITKKKLLKKSLKDYVIASASCYPVLKSKIIDHQSYIDGGVYDNLPINLAIKMGAERIIAIDLKAPGIKKSINNKDVEVIRIYPRNKIVSFLIFNKDESKKAISFGYNDTMKTFNKLEGNKFTFKKGELKENYYKYREDIVTITNNLSNTDNLLLNAIISFNDINNIRKNKDFIKLHNDIIEYLGKTFELDESKIYKMNQFNEMLRIKFNEIGFVDKLSEKVVPNPKTTISYIFGIFNSEKINIKKVIKLMLMYKKEFMGALYLYSIEIN